jgi:LysM repeat protein
MRRKFVHCALSIGLVLCGLVGNLALAQAPNTYVVQPGDTLLGIALKLNVPAATLQALNELTNPDMLRVGQVLKLPAPRVASTYVVQAGDTLGAIALRFRVSVDDLMRANQLADPNKLRIGQRLVIPSSGSVEITPTAIPQPTVSSDVREALRARLLALYNRARSANGLPPLTQSSTLEAAAQAHADDCAARGWCSHIGSDGSRASQRIARAGYVGRFSGENWAWAREADQAFDMWYTQEIPTQGPHWKNILSPYYTEVGFGVAAWRGGYFFIANFGGR